MSGLSILVRITAIIFMVEGLIMFVLSRFEDIPTQLATLLDAVFLVLISSPFLFWLVIKPYVDGQTRDIRRARDAAQRASSAKDEFLAHMSHELRTPLNAVIGFAQLLQHNPTAPLDAAQTDYTNSIVHSGEHLLELINGMLDLAAIEAKRMDLTIEDVNAKALLDDCIALMRPAAEGRGVTLANDMPDGFGVLLRTDLVRLKQALLNLLSNAIKYNKDGGTVTLDGRVVDAGHLRISVTDTGKGIAPEHVDNIFEPFHRLGVESTRSIEGTGIGLTVTKKLIELMGGRIGFESREGEGSTFWIELPLAKPETEMIWNDDLSVGVEDIDDDHKVLVALLNKVSDHNLGHEEVDEVLYELLNYTGYHFKHEEDIMVAHGYPNLESHRQLHRALAAKAERLAQHWRETEDPEVIAQLLDFLRTWLVQHIMEDDKAIGIYVQDRQAAPPGNAQ